MNGRFFVNDTFLKTVIGTVGLYVLMHVEEVSIKEETDKGYRWGCVRGCKLHPQYMELTEAELAYLADGMIRKLLFELYMGYRFAIYVKASFLRNGEIEINFTADCMD